MSTVVEFDGIKLRSIDERDRELVARWIAADPSHREQFTAEFFLGQFPDGSSDPRPTCYAIEDDNGVVFFVRLARVARAYIQFGPGQDQPQRARNRDALSKGMAFFENYLARAGAEEWIFSTNNPMLRASAKIRLGFEESPDELARKIDPPDEMKMHVNASAEGCTDVRT